MITYDVNLCIGTDDPNKRLAVKCHDTGVNLRIHLRVCRHGKWRDEFEPYHIPKGSTAVLHIVKPDKKYCITDGTVGADDVFFELPPQAFTAPGVSKADVALYGQDGKRISSATFYIDVPEECICGCDLDSENYIDVMSEQIRSAIDAANRAENAATAAAASAKQAEEKVNNAAWVAAEIDANGHLILSQSENFNGATFALNEKGNLEVTYT